MVETYDKSSFNCINYFKKNRNENQEWKSEKKQPSIEQIQLKSKI